MPDRCYNKKFRKQVSEVLNPIELKAFRSVNRSVGWLGTNSSLLYSFYCSWLQQRTKSNIARSNLSDKCIESAEEIRKSISYIRPEKGDFKQSVLVFVDASQ